MTKPKSKTLIEVFRDSGITCDDVSPQEFIKNMERERDKRQGEVLLQGLVNLIPSLMPGSSFIFEYNKKRIEINVK